MFHYFRNVQFYETLRDYYIEMCQDKTVVVLL